MKPAPIKERIVAALKRHGGHASYHKIMDEVFPTEQFPRAWRCSSNGGPPGCAFAFGAALRRLDIHDNYKQGSARMLSMPSHLRHQ